MALFDWRTRREVSWENRYPEYAIGYGLWRERRGQDGVMQDILRLRSEPGRARPARPCIFVSHRQEDVDYALRVAWLACRKGFEFWLDVLDPELSWIPAGMSSSLATASMIEMALLNSTHVLAVMTTKTKGSQWVPYEYGRVKEDHLTSSQAACWVDPALCVANLPEYMQLGITTRDELELAGWLASEAKRFKVIPGSCSWSEPIPTPLP